METSRNLARADPWQQSLERSRARRSRSKRKRSLIELLSARGMVPLALLAAATLASVLDGHGPQASASAARGRVSLAAVGSPDSRVGLTAPAPKRAQVPTSSPCPQVVSSTGYVNPLARARVKPERIDQGVDYAGSGALVAIGTGTVTYLATSGTGWPGPFIEYRLRDGPDAGCYVFYAEGVIPARGLRVGDAISAGQPIASIVQDYPTGLEIGWGAGVDTKTYAAATGQWTSHDDQDNIATAAGKSFSSLIASLGGPPGKVEG